MEVHKHLVEIVHSKEPSLVPRNEQKVLILQGYLKDQGITDMSLLPYDRDKILLSKEYELKTFVTTY